MAYLMFFFLILLPGRALAYEEAFTQIAVIYDMGNPDRSVGLVDGRQVETGDELEDYRVQSFEPDAIIMEHHGSRELFKFHVMGEPESEALDRARYRFIINQLKAVHAAQMQYLQEFKQGFAPDLETLIRRGYLPDGFTDQVKQGYRFEIGETGWTERRAPHYKREATFQAFASPVNQEAERFYFLSVDELGLVRYGKNRTLAAWGPVWDYTNPVEALSYEVIQAEADR